MLDPARAIIRAAATADAAAIADLLGSRGLSAEGVLVAGSRYLVAEDGAGCIVGVIGLEYGPPAVLLRSAAVHAGCQGRGLGARLLAAAYRQAASDQCWRVYLFSTGAGSYWQRQGFYEVPVPQLVEALPRAFQVRHYAERGWLPTEIAWRKDLPHGDQPVAPGRAADRIYCGDRPAQAGAAQDAPDGWLAP